MLELEKRTSATDQQQQQHVPWPVAKASLVSTFIRFSPSTWCASFIVAVSSSSPLPVVCSSRCIDFVTAAQRCTRLWHMEGGRLSQSDHQSRGGLHARGRLQQSRTLQVLRQRQSVRGLHERAPQVLRPAHWVARRSGRLRQTAGEAGVEVGDLLRRHRHQQRCQVQVPQCHQCRQWQQQQQQQQRPRYHQHVHAQHSTHNATVSTRKGFATHNLHIFLFFCAFLHDLRWSQETENVTKHFY